MQYAEPPIGDLRFRPAQPKGQLISPFDAREFGPACTQPFADPEVPLSEDCLTLNIQRPAGTNDSSALPVMLWIHGGGFLFGRSSSPEFNATNFVSYSGTPIIYVNINYRLGPLGFPQGTDAARHGLLNLGLKDQFLAFRWVHDNIAAFGGDPKRVTLFGESAGAMSISAHLFNPELEKLVIGANTIVKITHSGAASATGGRPNLRDGDWNRFLEATGCLKPGDDTWTCLRQSNSQALLRATQTVSSWDDPLAFLPCIDGPGGVIPDQPSKLLQNLRFVNLPIITGVNLDEGTMLTPESVNSTHFIKDFLLKQYSGSSPHTEDLSSVVDTLLDLYPDIPSLGSPYGTGNETFGLSAQYKRMAALYGDLLIVAPVRYHNRFLAKAGIPTYTYRFTQKQESTIPHWGVAHSANIPFVYGQPHEPVSASSRRLSTRMMDYWLSFAYTQTPNDGIGSQREEWLPYTSDYQYALQLDGDHMGMIPDDYRARQIDFIIDSYPVIGL
ncbi:hypothetical protein ONZ45_g5958 [Pleurotus djamor]|nr:hypothetical protein ONZ45_g5958 [Pleurotus djamor]